MAKHNVTFVVSALVDLGSVQPDDDAMVQAIIGIFRGHAQVMEGQFDLLSLPHTIKVTLFNSAGGTTIIGHKQ